MIEDDILFFIAFLNIWYVLGWTEGGKYWVIYSGQWGNGQNPVWNNFHVMSILLKDSYVGVFLAVLYCIYIHIFYLFWGLIKSIFLLTDIRTVAEGECSSTSCATQGSFPSVSMLLHDLSLLNHQSPHCLYSSCCRHFPGIDLLSAFCFHHWMPTTLDRFEVPPLIIWTFREEIIPSCLLEFEFISIFVPLSMSILKISFSYP